MIYSVDGEYTLLQSSTSGKANYERLGKDKKSKKNKLYYYSPLEQYVESNDGINTSIESINPQEKNKISLNDLSIIKKDKKEKRDQQKIQATAFFFPKYIVFTY